MSLNRHFSSRSQLDEKLASAVAGLLSKAIEERGKAVLVVSGGSTPLGFFDQLSTQSSVDWSLVSITLADERWVDPCHADSNERLVRERLLVNRAVKARFISFRGEADSPEQACQSLSEQLQSLGVIDALVLGMGTDGHTASLFPGAESLLDAVDLQSEQNNILIRPLHADYLRLSMTLRRLLNSRQIFLHITGQEKKEVLKLASTTEELSQFPVSYVLQQSNVPLIVFYAD